MGNDGLFEMPGRPQGRHEKAVLAAIESARQKQIVDETDGGLISLAIANASALDAAELINSPKAAYPIAQLTGGYLDVLRALAMTPEGRIDSADDELREAIADLGAASVRDA